MPILGNILSIPSNARQSWSSYWTKQDECHEFWDHSKFDGNGDCIGSKRGDILHRTGTVGNYHYTLPNTATYKALDTDYAWFKSNGDVSDTTSARLVGYDLQRTVTKYDDDSPNTERWTMILGSAVTGTKRDKMFQSFHLPIMWDDSWNDYGREKSNRPDTEQVLWTPESVYEPETDALLSRMVVQPSTSLAELIDKTIADLKTALIWDRLDVIRFYGMHTSQAALLNWKGNFSNASIVNGCAHTPKVGFLISSASGGKYLNSNYNPTVNGVNYLQNDAMFGGYTPTELAVGAALTGVGSTYLWPRSAVGSGNRIFSPINPTGAPNQAWQASSIGLSCAERKLSTHYHGVKNGVVLADVADTSTAIPNANFNEGQSGAWGGTISEIHYGGSLTPTQHSTFYNIIKYFIDNVGGTF